MTSRIRSMMGGMMTIALAPFVLTACQTSEPSPPISESLDNSDNPASLIGARYPGDGMPSADMELLAASMLPALRGTEGGITHAKQNGQHLVWLQVPAATDAQGSITEWEIVDVVAVPPAISQQLEANESTLFIGGRCRRQGDMSAADIVAVMARAETEWFETEQLVWQIDAQNARLQEVPAGDIELQCENPNLG
ncbi:hypothetical protein ACQ4M4_24630 [Leptolyngbya sp. AN02str]|uniref:hypothetical protein n=1 Tax=Leptolyngbya sp. AN02str TaxID=3423363 RepID=UPI003D31AC6D